MYKVTDVKTVFTTNMQVWLWSISLQYSHTKLYGSLVMAIKLTDIYKTQEQPCVNAHFTKIS